MGTRGRKSAASLQVVRDPAVTEKVQRPEAPMYLNDEQAEIWTAVVETQAADWFQPDTFPLLEAYCRHAVSARRVAQLIEAEGNGETLDVDAYDQLLKMQEREGRALSSLATRMRISQQALTNHRGNKNNKTKPKPWEG